MLPPSTNDSSTQPTHALHINTDFAKRPSSGESNSAGSSATFLATEESAPVALDRLGSPELQDRSDDCDNWNGSTAVTTPLSPYTPAGSLGKRSGLHLNNQEISDLYSGLNAALTRNTEESAASSEQLIPRPISSFWLPSDTDHDDRSSSGHLGVGDETKPETRWSPMTKIRSFFSVMGKTQVKRRIGTSNQESQQTNKPSLPSLLEITGQELSEAKEEAVLLQDLSDSLARPFFGRLTKPVTLAMTVSQS
ncbi:hypothetical protein BCR39DRAFT_79244 [Naematelia encephala]|uniref:Uncharacterized protein n=1 Tax=Naematelia encephala TaxID=71784 RepID=A0A1Y2BA88_9TREE|nr:hypothetical protein BCR39DRAFT_79244 [Naematelia encephala]